MCGRDARTTKTVMLGLWCRRLACTCGRDGRTTRALGRVVGHAPAFSWFYRIPAGAACVPPSRRPRSACGILSSGKRTNRGLPARVITFEGRRKPWIEPAPWSEH